MDHILHEKSSFNNLLIDHNIIDFKYHSHDYLQNKYKIDENEKKLIDFISDNKIFKIKIIMNIKKKILIF